MPQRTLNRRDFLRTTAAAAAATLAAGLGAVGYVHAIEPDWLEITGVELRLPGLAAEFDGYRIAQLSDIHFDYRGMDRARLDAIVARLNAERPDLAALTGDFVSLHPARCEDDLRGGLAALKAADGVVAIAGNHDYWYDGGIWMPRIARASGAIWLKDEVRTIRRGAGLLHVAGLDDCWQVKRLAPPISVHEQRVRRLAAAVPAEGAAILLAHEPDIADLAAQTGRFALQLSGHSHGGQVRLPGLGMPILPPYGQKYPSGLYQVGTLQQYTSRGVGSPLRVRLNCRPELAILTLRPA